jgi:hypothetical protein
MLPFQIKRQDPFLVSTMCVTTLVFKNEDGSIRDDDSKLNAISFVVLNSEMTWIDLFSCLTSRMRRASLNTGVIGINFNGTARWTLGNCDLLKIGKEIIYQIETVKKPIEIIVVSARYRTRG